MNDKDKQIINKLVSLANKQQKLIHKLAQQLPPDALPTSGTTYHPGQDPMEKHPLLPTELHPIPPSKAEADTILNHLPETVKNNLVNLEVHDNLVKVKWKAPVPNLVFNTVVKTVQNLEAKNLLPGSSYKVLEVA